MATGKVDAYLERIEEVLRGEIMKYTAMDHEEAVKSCGAALRAVTELKGKIGEVEDVKGSYLRI